MVALLRHFLAGSLLLLAVFVSTSDAKAKCTQGGICFGKQFHNVNFTYEEIFKPVECYYKCYRFYCYINGGINAGVGCKESVKIHCPNYADEILKGEYNKDNWLYGRGFAAHQCADDKCQIPDRDYYLQKVDELYQANEPLIDQVTVDTCEYNPSPPPTAGEESGISNDDIRVSSTAVVYGTSMVLLGSVVVGCILALRLW